MWGCAYYTYMYVNRTILLRFYGQSYACANRVYQATFSSPAKKNERGPCSPPSQLLLNCDVTLCTMHDCIGSDSSQGQRPEPKNQVVCYEVSNRIVTTLIFTLVDQDINLIHVCTCRCISVCATKCCMYTCFYILTQFFSPFTWIAQCKTYMTYCIGECSVLWACMYNNYIHMHVVHSEVK